MIKNVYPHIDMYQMRRCAIGSNWFTCGDCEQYNKWLSMGGHGHKITPTWLYKVAKMAVEYSDLEELGYSLDDDMEGILDNFAARLLMYADVHYS